MTLQSKSSSTNATAPREASPLESADLPSPQVLIDEFVGRWWVLHTKARNEKALSGTLERLEIQHFLPLVRYKRLYGGRIRRVEIPLFPGYVFLCGSDEDRLVALKTNRIASVLEVVDQERLRDDLRQINLAVHGDEPIDLYPGLRSGSRCRVVSGSLSGLEGVVLRRRGPWRVYVGVEFVGQSAELEIDPALLELID
ncbi:MAG: UpxY family transcription antiterminator [Phycisphaerales bacterium]|nr:MAG: UpxY family transcription antiterminator [Phycisphaerales bacterium]